MTAFINKSEMIGDFDYKKYCSLIMSVLPEKFKINLSSIYLVDNYDDAIGCDNDGYGCYVTINNNGVAFINIKNLSLSKIPLYLYARYPEISGLFLSEIIGHEFGHHVSAFYIKNECGDEEFANKYASACYYYYFNKRKIRIVLSYCLASISFCRFNRDDRSMFKKSINDILQWSSNNKYIDFPEK